MCRSSCLSLKRTQNNTKVKVAWEALRGSEESKTKKERKQRPQKRKVWSSSLLSHISILALYLPNPFLAPSGSLNRPCPPQCFASTRTARLCSWQGGTCGWLPGCSAAHYSSYCNLFPCDWTQLGCPQMACPALLGSCITTNMYTLPIRSKWATNEEG